LPIITLNIEIFNLSTILGLYDKIQIFRSIDGVNGTYSEITAVDDTAPSITGSIAGPWNLVGKTLTVVANGGTPFSCTFTGTDPLDLATVLYQLNNNLSPCIASKVPGANRVLITSKLVGTGASLVFSGTAAAVLGISTTKVNGLAHRLSIKDPTIKYIFNDLDGDISYFYKTRYYNSVADVGESLSAPFQGALASVLDLGNLSTSTVKIANALGDPIVGRRIIFVPMSVQLVDDYMLLPTQDRLIFYTDSSGIAVITVAKGMRFKVFLEGTGYNREITIPNTDTFDLFNLMSDAPDTFTIVQLPPMPIRNTP